MWMLEHDLTNEVLMIQLVGTGSKPVRLEGRPLASAFPAATPPPPLLPPSLRSVIVRHGPDRCAEDKTIPAIFGMSRVPVLNGRLERSAVSSFCHPPPHRREGGDLRSLQVGLQRECFHTRTRLFSHVSLLLINLSRVKITLKVILYFRRYPHCPANLSHPIYTYYFILHTCIQSQKRHIWIHPDR